MHSTFTLNLSIRSMVRDLTQNFIQFIILQLTQKTQISLLLLPLVLSSILQTMIKTLLKKPQRLLTSSLNPSSMIAHLIQLLLLFITDSLSKPLIPQIVGFTKDQSLLHLVLKQSTGTSSRKCIQLKRRISIITETFSLLGKPNKILRKLETSEIHKQLHLIISYNFLQPR